MQLLALQHATDGAGKIEQIATTFGVDWVHLGAQIVSFSMVCAVLYALAYKPILRLLEARRQQIATGLANAEQIRIELAAIAAQRRDVLLRAEDAGKQLIEEARAAAVRVGTLEMQKATAAADEVLARATEATERERARMLAELRHEVGRLVIQTAASVTGKILTPNDQQRLAEETAHRLAS
jgi:F-type H+-transporting ATPase subunit b